MLFCGAVIIFLLWDQFFGYVGSLLLGLSQLSKQLGPLRLTNSYQEERKTKISFHPALAVFSSLPIHCEHFFKRDPLCTDIAVLVKS